MYTLSKLQAGHIIHQDVGILTTRMGVHHELAPGCFVHVLLSPEGLKLAHGNEGIHIPMAELVALAQRHCPALIPGSDTTVYGPAWVEPAET